MKIKELIKKHDKQNQFQVLIDSYKQIDFAWSNEINLDSIMSETISSIIICGMGGSAISADLLGCILYDELKISLSVIRDYNLPNYIDNNTLAIISSYSGNTEETVSCFNEALKRKCKIVSVSTGGQVKNIADENNIPWIKLQEGFQPRFALGASLFTVLKILQSLKLITQQDDFVNKVKILWERNGNEYSKEENHALKSAEELVGFIPVIYTSEKYKPVGYRLKCQFNENSKLHSFNNVIPEMNHNEIIGWETFLEKQLNAKVLFLLYQEYNPRIIKRFDIAANLIKKQGAEIIELKSNEENIKVRIMDLIYLGDWITFYLAVLRGFDPSEIDNINFLKQHLG